MNKMIQPLQITRKIDGTADLLLKITNIPNTSTLNEVLNSKISRFLQEEAPAPSVITEQLPQFNLPVSTTGTKLDIERKRYIYQLFNELSNGSRAIEEKYLKRTRSGILITSRDFTTMYNDIITHVHPRYQAASTLSFSHTFNSCVKINLQDSANPFVSGFSAFSELKNSGYHIRTEAFDRVKILTEADEKIMTVREYLNTH